MAGKSVMMAIQEGKSPIGGLSEEPPIERDLDIVEAGADSGMICQRAGKKTRVSFIAAREQ
jgi:hypothetical protein